MIAGLLRNQPESGAQEQLLKLYWNRAGVKRELTVLRRERYELLDKLKEQEAAIVRAQEQLEGLERLLTNPLAAANAMVYFQLRHLWRTASLRIEQFGKDLQLQREKRERAQLHEAALSKRRRRIAAIKEKLAELQQKRDRLVEETLRLQDRLDRMNVLQRIIKGPKLHRHIDSLKANRAILEERIEEFADLTEKIEGEPLPEPEDLSVESRRLINTALIALAQHLVVHFSEHELAMLAKASTEQPVADMKFGDRRHCDRMVEQIREQIDALRQDKTLAEKVRRRADSLVTHVEYRSENDATPKNESLATISVHVDTERAAPTRRSSDAPLHVNVLTDDYWGIVAVLR